MAASGFPLAGGTCSGKKNSTCALPRLIRALNALAAVISFWVNGTICQAIRRRSGGAIKQLLREPPPFQSAALPRGESVISNLLPQVIQDCRGGEEPPV